MFELIKFKMEHILPLLNQPINKKAGFTKEMAETAQTYESYTALVNGEPYWCGGIVKCWEGRGQVWSVFSEKSKYNFLPLFRGLKRSIDKLSYNRLELAIPCDFEIGKRRAQLFGFKLECEKAKKYLPNGVDCALYAWVRK
jgi:hypothetical protein